MTDKTVSTYVIFMLTIFNYLYCADQEHCQDRSLKHSIQTHIHTHTLHFTQLQTDAHTVTHMSESETQTHTRARIHTHTHTHTHTHRFIIWWHTHTVLSHILSFNSRDPNQDSISLTKRRASVNTNTNQSWPKIESNASYSVAQSPWRRKMRHWYCLLPGNLQYFRKSGSFYHTTVKTTRIRAHLHGYTKFYATKGWKIKLNYTMNGQLLHERTQRHTAKQWATTDTHN